MDMNQKHNPKKGALRNKNSIRYSS